MNIPEGLPRRAAPSALLAVLWAQPAAAQDATILFVALAPPVFLAPLVLTIGRHYWLRGISRIPHRELPCMLKVSDPAGATSTSRIAVPAVLPSAQQEGVGLREHSAISRLNTRPARAPVNVSRTPLPTPTHDSGAV